MAPALMPCHLQESAVVFGLAVFIREIRSAKMPKLGCPPPFARARRSQHRAEGDSFSRISGPPLFLIARIEIRLQNQGSSL
jgi:hypothetical protein